MCRISSIFRYLGSYNIYIQTILLDDLGYRIFGILLDV